tara:strand:+ start:771 stop:887 length:117 start_codon:yes stop_codon:yes gene_type:complete
MSAILNEAEEILDKKTINLEDYKRFRISSASFKIALIS